MNVCKNILENSGWRQNVLIETDDTGTITSISESNLVDKDVNLIEGFVLPGFQNAHSHAFQYAMAGLAENHEISNNPDDFWSWRDEMYQLALKVNPDQMEAIASMLYSEMVRQGYTNVAEFHYIHHHQLQYKCRIQHLNLWQ